MPRSDSLGVAFVCTGNRFRSPLAAAVLAAEGLEEPLRIASLGTLDLGPVPALPEAVELGTTFGLDLSTHHARSFRDVDLEPFDLVLGFERMHVAAAVVDGDAAIERTFTLPELVGLLEALPAQPLPPDAVERARVLIRRAHAARPPDFQHLPVPELADPLGRPASEQRETATEVRRLVHDLVRQLFA